MNIQLNKLSLKILIILLLLVPAGLRPASAPGKKLIGTAKPRYNVLFLFIDDLRPELGCYGSKNIHSPNIDGLASGATLFKRHYVMVPTCGPSRACLLTGRRPRNIDEISNDVLEKKLRAQVPPNIPESFVDNLRLNGYYTVGMGKISHSPDGYIYKYTEQKGTKRELPASWNEMLLDPGQWGTGWNAFFGYAGGKNRNDQKNQVTPYESADVADEGYPDGLTAALAVKKLEELAGRKKPFFLGVGFFKPHLPFNAPKKYWDLYDRSKIELTPSPGLSKNVNVESLHESSEFNGGYKLGDEKASLSKPVSDDYARKLRHGYFAGVSYMDAQVGKVLAALKKLGLEKNTIIVLWGDHGWHLGDNRVWGKHTLSEWSLRSPLIVKTPGLPKGAVSNKIVSSVDIYPTLMELCGIKSPGNLDGKSFVMLLKDPESNRWQNLAYSYFKKGISLRTDTFRFSKYFRSQLPDQELYDHSNDAYETNNISSFHPEINSRLLPLLEKGNTGLYNTKPLLPQNPTEGQ
ncbi:MAG: sulfatase [Chitinophagaceae bacterium]